MPAGVSAWTPLANITLSGAASTVTFSSISGSYRDLVLIIENTQGTGTTAAGLRLRFNSDTGSNYSYVNMVGSGSATSSGSGTLTEVVGGLVDPAKSIVVYNILDYSATDKHKTVLVRGDNSAVNTTATAVRWAHTAAITTILAYPSSGTFAAGSSFALYGVSA